MACAGWPAVATSATFDRSIRRGDGCAPRGDDAAEPIVVHARATAAGSCAFTMDDPPRGHRLAVAARLRSIRGDRTDVALLVTQFGRDDLLVHQFAVAVAEPGREARVDLSAYVVPDAERLVIVVQAIGADSDVELDDLSLVASPDAIAPGAMADGPRAYLERALAFVVRHALGDAAKQPSLVADARRFASGATTTSDTYPAIREVLARLDPSGHSRVIPPTTVEAFFETPALPPFGIGTGVLDDRIGYLRVPHWTSLDPRERARFARELRRLLLATVGAPSPHALVLDLRSDGGGAFRAMLDGLCPLFEPHRALGAFRDRAGRRDPWRCDARPSGRRTRRLADVPVAVLIGPGSASAGEMLAIALEGRANTVLIGARTAGFTTGVEAMRMSDGALLAVATSVSVRRNGRVVERFVDPAIRVPDASEASGDPDDAAVRAALEWIAARPGRLRPHLR